MEFEEEGFMPQSLGDAPRQSVVSCDQIHGEDKLLQVKTLLICREVKHLFGKGRERRSLSSEKPEDDKRAGCGKSANGTCSVNLCGKSHDGSNNICHAHDTRLLLLDA